MHRLPIAPSPPTLATPVAPRVPAAPRTAAPAEDGLRAANRLRAEGRFREAEQAYLSVLKAYPGSSAAYVARVAAGTLRLDHLGDPRGARALLKPALSAKGPLDLEVRSGLERANQLLGEPSAAATKDAP